MKLSTIFLFGCLCLATPALADEVSAPAADADATAPDRLSILSDQDRLLYRRIFDLQQQGEWKQADRLIRDLGDKVLMGHVLHQRYMHPTAWRSRYSELKSWLAEYGDHPDAERIYRLARKRQGNAAAPRRPLKQGYAGSVRAVAVEQPKGPVRGADDERTVNAFRSVFDRELRRNRIDRAEKRLWAIERTDLASPHELADALGRLAHAYYLDSDDPKALALATIAADYSPRFADSANWYGGLAAFRLDDCDSAEPFFARLSQSPTAGAWLRAGGGFWAARAALLCERPELVSLYLKRASDEQDTFYGLIAARQLGITLNHDWSLPALSLIDFTALSRQPAVRRAIALHEIDDDNRADAELKLLLGRSEKAAWPVLAGLAARLGLPGSQLRIAKALKDADPPSALNYPLPDWEPDGGFTVDRALLFAFIRQESQFSARASSHAGASGLMQVMPATASYISGDRSLRWEKAKLYEPRFNMALGQQYIEHLADLPVVEGNLFMLAVAYNAGPGNLSRWKKRIAYKNDPLLFIESLPAWETRDYIEHVMANLWLYRMRLGQPSPSLDAVAANAWPLFEMLDPLGDGLQLTALPGRSHAGN